MIEIKTDAMFTALAQRPLALVDFYASWCSPCRVLSPILEQLSSMRKFASVTFAKVDVDKFDAIAAHYRVTAMPTLIVFKNGREVARIVGIDREKILNTLEKYVSQ